ncbi:recombinase family protein [Lacipirellula sp.]|uniref:recombinase family protein n=1 Tax=Lacipirellula sp. TaxID=2691419 RepID=UPI003D0CA605
MSTDSKPRVYSYLRFSRPEQALGDSERRQIEGARAFAKRKNLPFDESISLQDRGRSAFTGAHRKKGSLGTFLALVRAGAVPRGSILVVENVDRLSREGVAASLRKIIFDLFDFGITIQTLNPEIAYAPGCENDPTFIALFIYLARAYDESKQKSTRLSQAWEQKRKTARDAGEMLTRIRPAWLAVTGERTFKIIEPAAEAVRAIFTMYLQGLGTRRIVATLNRGTTYWKPPHNPKRKSPDWRASYVRKILNERSVLGEYQPHKMVAGKRTPDGDAILDYFPAIVPTDLFNAVAAKLHGNEIRGGQTGKASSLLTHMAYCGYCGEPMHFVDKGKGPRGRQYLRCANEASGRGCDCGNFRYDEVEELVLSNCPKLNPAEVLPNPDDQAKQCRGLRTQLAANDEQLTQTERRLANLTDQMADAGDKAVRSRLQAKMEELEASKQKLHQLGAELMRDLRASENDIVEFGKWKQDLGELSKQLASGDVDLRLRVRSHLRQFILRVECYTHGTPADGERAEPTKPLRTVKKGQVACFPKGEYSDDIAEYIEAIFDEYDLPRGKPGVFSEFLEYAAARRKTRAARYIKVIFNTGKVLRLVPLGSIADGLAWRGDAQWDIVRPDIDQLWRQFKKARYELQRQKTGCSGAG